MKSYKKSNMKLIYKIALGLLVVGLIIGGVGYAAGGRFNRSYSLNGIVYELFGSWDDDHDDLPMTGATAAPATLPATPAAANSHVTELDFDLGYGSFYLVESAEKEPFTYETTAKLATAKAKLTGDGAWHVSLSGQKSQFDDEPVYLYVPVGFQPKDIDIDIRAGELTADTLNATDLNIDLGAGSVSLGTVNAREFECSIGAGQLAFTSMTTQDFSCDIGAGALTGEMLDTGALDADVGAGQMELTLTGAQSAYGYDAECGLGMLEFGDETLVDVHGSAQRDGSPMLELNVALGSILIEFAE